MAVADVIHQLTAPFGLLQSQDYGLVLLEALISAILIFFALSPDWKRIVFKATTDVDIATTSDIPGNPHVIDFSMISALRTLPEPNNFNMVLTKVPYEREVIIEGYMPPARMFSVSAYKQGGSVPESLKLANGFNQTRHQHPVRILLTKKPEQYKDSKEFDLVVFTHDWKCGMVCIRNYLVPSGTTVFTPRLLYKDTGEVFRPPRKLVAGPTNLHIHYGPYLTHQVFLVAIHLLVIFGVNAVLLPVPKFYPTNVLVTLGAFLLVRGIYALLYAIGKRRINEVFLKGSPDFNNTIKLVDVEGKAHDSSPSKLHRYYSLRYDVQPGQELKLHFRIQEQAQDYWSFICYDEYGLPLPNYVYDENAIREEIRADGSYTVTLYLVNRGQSGPLVDHAYEAAGKRNEIDVSSSPRGNVLYRLVHPVDEASVQASRPQIDHVRAIELANDSKKRA